MCVAMNCRHASLERRVGGAFFTNHSNYFFSSTILYYLSLSLSNSDCAIATSALAEMESFLLSRPQMVRLIQIYLH